MVGNYNGAWGPHIRCGAGGGFSLDAAHAVANLMGGRLAVVVNDDYTKGATEDFAKEMPLTRWLLLQGADVVYRVGKEDIGLKDDDLPANVNKRKYCETVDTELYILERGLPDGLKARVSLGNELAKTESERDQDYLIWCLEYFGHRGRLCNVANWAVRTPMDYILGMERLHNAMRVWNAKMGFHEGTYDGFETYEKARAGGWIGAAAEFQEKTGIEAEITEFAGSKDAWHGWEDLYRNLGGAQAWFEVLQETGDRYLLPNKLKAAIFSAFDWRYFFAYYHRNDLMLNVGTYNRAHPVQNWTKPVANTLPAANDPRWTLVVANANGTFVNVRSTPVASGITNKVGEIGKNQTLHIIVDENLVVREGSNVWRPVKLLTGVIGWASVAVFTFAPVQNSVEYDMKAYFFPDAGVNVRHRFNSDEVIYTYLGADGRSYIGKNEQWEQGWLEIINGVEYLMRGFDISNHENPQARTVYALFREQYRGPQTPLGDEWSPRFMRPMVPFFRHAWVQVFKNDGTPVAAGSGWDDTWIRIKKHHPTFTTFYGKVFEDVLEVQYSHYQDFRDTNESYFVARGHGYVEWTDGVMHTAALNDFGVRSPGTPIRLSWWNLPTIKQPVGGEPVVTNPNAEPTTPAVQMRLRSGVAVNVRSKPTTTGNNPIGSIPGGSLVVVKYPEKQVTANGYNWVWCSYGSLGGWVAITAAPMFLSAAAQMVAAPYFSQWGHASGRTGLCGPTTSRMALGWDRQRRARLVPVEITVDTIANHIGMPNKGSLSNMVQNQNALRDYGVECQRRTDLTEAIIRQEISAGRPVALLIHYSYISDRGDKAFTGLHIVLVVGFDAEADVYYVHDPDYPDQAGSQRLYKGADFRKSLTGDGIIFGA